jgi:hypothetical protein
MPVVTKAKLEEILTRRLKLRDPHFRLERMGARLSGSVIDGRFARLGDLARQRMIWDALDKELGADSYRRVGTILAYSPLEWDLPLEGKAKNRARRAISNARTN